MTVDVIKYFSKYNAWANEILFKGLEQLTPEQYHTPGVSGNGSLHKTLTHHLSVELGWFSWLDGTITQEQLKNVGSMVTPDEIPDLATARKRSQEIDKKIEAYVATLTEESMQEFIGANRPNAKLWAPRWKIMMHVLNHGTHTRAQIVAAIRHLGYNPGIYELLWMIIGDTQAENAPPKG